MTQECALVLYFLQFIGRNNCLEASKADYAGTGETDEAAELAHFVKTAESGGITPPAPSLEVRITREMRIFMGRQELKIRPMSKAILLLFLLHPEGITLKRIGDYADELTCFYAKVSRSDDPSRIRQSVDRVIDVFSNELNVNLSRVNAAISALGKSREYQVNGKAGESKAIPLDRSLVIWE